jgi:hypothetical protein
MTLQGKGFFTWWLVNVEKGNVQAIASLAKAADLTHVLIKVADGPVIYNVDRVTGYDHALAAAQALRAQGIKVWAWHYVYGDNPDGEASMAIRRCHQIQADGYVINAEQEYKRSGMRDRARRFMSLLRTSLPNLPMALSSYRYPSLHPELPWREFLNGVDISMPQVYWMKATNPAQQLIRTVREYQAMTPLRPIVPTGAAFREHGWQPSVAEVLEFLNTAKSLNLQAVNFWEWSNARSGNLPGVWEAIRDYAWYGEPRPADIAERYMAALNARDVSQILALYAPAAVHITATRTIQGTTALHAWYNNFLNQLLPNANFTLTGYSGSGTSRHLTWTATSSRGKVLNGSDTLGISEDRIVYHYTFFSISP